MKEWCTIEPGNGAILSGSVTWNRTGRKLTVKSNCKAMPGREYEIWEEPGGAAPEPQSAFASFPG